MRRKRARGAVNSRPSQSVEDDPPRRRVERHDRRIGHESGERAQQRAGRRRRALESGGGQRHRHRARRRRQAQRSEHAVELGAREVLRDGGEVHVAGNSQRLGRLQRVPKLRVTAPDRHATDGCLTGTGDTRVGRDHAGLECRDERRQLHERARLHGRLEPLRLAAVDGGECREIDLLPGGARRLGHGGLRAQRRRRYERQRHRASHPHAPAPMNRATSAHRGSMCWSNW